MMCYPWYELTDEQPKSPVVMVTIIGGAACVIVVITIVWSRYYTESLQHWSGKRRWDGSGGWIWPTDLSVTYAVECFVTLKRQIGGS